MKKYIKPTIKVRYIYEENSLLAANSGTTTITGAPSNDLGGTTKSGTASGTEALSKSNNIFWDDEEE